MVRVYKKFVLRRKEGEKMKVIVTCEKCEKTFKIKVENMKEVRRIKKANGCTCMKCIGPTMLRIYGDTVMFTWG